MGSCWSFCDASRQTGLGEAVTSAQAGNSLLGSGFTGELPWSIPKFLPCSLCSRRMSKAFPAHSGCCWAPSSCPPLGRSCCCLDVFYTPTHQLCRELFSCWNTQHNNATQRTFQSSGSPHPFKRVEIMSTKRKSRVAVWIEEREGEPGAEGQQEEEKWVTGAQRGRTLQGKSKGWDKAL